MCFSSGLFIVGVTVVPRKGAGLLGIQIKLGDGWRRQGEQGNSENQWVGSDNSGIKDTFLQAFKSLWNQLWILMKTNGITNFVEVPVALTAASQFALILTRADGMTRNPVLRS